MAKEEKMQIGGVLNNDPNQIRRHITEYYKDLFGQVGSWRLTLHEDIWEDTKLSTEEASNLTKPFSLEETKQDMFEMEGNEAPGIDGFHIKIYQKFWDVIHNDLFRLFSTLENGQLFLKRLKYAIIYLIPKKKGDDRVENFRPISLLNCSYKIVTKVLTSRLNGVIAKLISGYQTTFINGRYIHNSMVSAHELIHNIKLRKGKGILLKLNFEEVYDKVR